MVKKRRNKKTKQEKQSHEPDDTIPINTSSSSNSMNPNDFISNLPDNILHHIISYLPFESAVRTSFLSTHWKHLWKETLLDSVHDVTTEAAIKAIQSFLDGFDTHCRPRNKWGFIFEFSNGRNILAASISRNGTLRLDFSAGKQEFPMPFDLDLKPLQTQLPYSNTMKVKSLYLVSVSHLSNVAVSSLVPNLPFLESLTIAKCKGLQSLQIKEAKVLHKLVVLDCPQLQSLSFEGSCLRCFRYRGKLVSFRFQGYCKCTTFRRICICECGLFLKDAMIDLRQGSLAEGTWDFEKPPGYRYSYNLYKRTLCRCTTKKKCFKSILISIRSVKSLTICRWFFETSMCCLLSSNRDSLFCLSGLKELWWIDCSMNRESINVLLWFLKLCPHLERLYVTIDPKCYNMPSTGKFSTLFIVPDKLSDLKAIKLEGFADEENEIFMARRLIPLFGDNNPVIISKSDGKCLKHLMKVAKLEKRGKYPYKFKVVENVSENFPNHVHANL
ncbi:F-box protein [Gossypium australe]|uniref:F-box protein n=1 Tax=Gossypium australe TaxID=47621 RepID=A0A5B6UB50_9ROSI|nr:F-box protein [Gossypium australe]